MLNLIQSSVSSFVISFIQTALQLVLLCPILLQRVCRSGQGNHKGPLFSCVWVAADVSFGHGGTAKFLVVVGFW